MEDNFVENLGMYAALIDISSVIFLSIFSNKIRFDILISTAVAIFVIIVIPKMVWSSPDYWGDIFEEPSSYRNVWAFPLIIFNSMLLYILRFFVKKRS